MTGPSTIEINLDVKVGKVRGVIMSFNQTLTRALETRRWIETRWKVCTDQQLCRNAQVATADVNWKVPVSGLLEVVTTLQSGP